MKKHFFKFLVMVFVLSGLASLVFASGVWRINQNTGSFGYLRIAPEVITSLGLTPGDKIGAFDKRLTVQTGFLVGNSYAAFASSEICGTGLGNPACITSAGAMMAIFGNDTYTVIKDGFEYNEFINVIVEKNGTNYRLTGLVYSGCVGCNLSKKFQGLGFYRLKSAQLGQQVNLQEYSEEDYVVANPTFTPPSNLTVSPRTQITYNPPLQVTLSTTPGAEIRYTLDESRPTSDSTLYTNPIILTTTKKIRAKGFKTGLIPSETISKTYKVVLPTVADLSANPDGGIYSSPQTITLSTTTVGTTIRYTLNGISPTESSPIYSEPITISSSKTLKAKGFKTGYLQSNILSKWYNIAFSSTVATPTISTSIEQNHKKSITLTTSTAGATIKYTLNGSDPKTSAGIIYNSNNKPTIQQSTTVKAYAYKTNMTDSQITTEFIDNKLPKTTIGKPSGTYTNPVIIVMNNPFNRAKKRYTLDGSEPINTSDIRTSPITISQTTTVKTKSFADGYTPSDTLTKEYVIENSNRGSQGSGQGGGQCNRTCIDNFSCDESKQRYCTIKENGVKKFANLSFLPNPMTEEHYIAIRANATNLYPATVFSGINIEIGDTIAVFYNDNGQLKNAGLAIWNGDNIALRVQKDDNESLVPIYPNEKNGFIEEEKINFRLYKNDGKIINLKITYDLGDTLTSSNGNFETNGLSAIKIIEPYNTQKNNTQKITNRNNTPNYGASSAKSNNTAEKVFKSYLPKLQTMLKNSKITEKNYLGFLNAVKKQVKITSKNLTAAEIESAKQSFIEKVKQYILDYFKNK